MISQFYIDSPTLNLVHSITTIQYMVRWLIFSKVQCTILKLGRMSFHPRRWYEFHRGGILKRRFVLYLNFSAQKILSVMTVHPPKTYFVILAPASYHNSSLVDIMGSSILGKVWIYVALCYNFFILVITQASYLTTTPLFLTPPPWPSSHGSSLRIHLT